MSLHGLIMRLTQSGSVTSDTLVQTLDFIGTQLRCGMGGWRQAFINVGGCELLVEVLDSQCDLSVRHAALSAILGVPLRTPVIARFTAAGAIEAALNILIDDESAAIVKDATHFLKELIRGRLDYGQQVVDALVDAIQGADPAAAAGSPSKGLVEVPLAQHTVELLDGAAGAQVELDENLLQALLDVLQCYKKLKVARAAPAGSGSGLSNVMHCLDTLGSWRETVGHTKVVDALVAVVACQDKQLEERAHACAILGGMLRWGHKMAQLFEVSEGVDVLYTVIQEAAQKEEAAPMDEETAALKLQALARGNSARQQVQMEEGYRKAEEAAVDSVPLEQAEAVDLVPLIAQAVLTEAAVSCLRLYSAVDGSRANALVMSGVLPHLVTLAVDVQPHMASTRLSALSLLHHIISTTAPRGAGLSASHVAVIALGAVPGGVADALVTAVVAELYPQDDWLPKCCEILLLVAGRGEKGAGALITRLLSEISCATSSNESRRLAAFALRHVFLRHTTNLLKVRRSASFEVHSYAKTSQGIQVRRGDAGCTQAITQEDDVIESHGAVGVLASVVGDCTVGIGLAQEAATALAEISSSSKKGAAAVEAAMVQAMQAADATGDEHTQTKMLQRIGWALGTGRPVTLHNKDRRGTQLMY